MLSRYFDNSASYPVSPSVIELLQQAYAEMFANPASSHKLGQQAFDKVNKARLDIATLFGAPQGSIYFSSGATEAINILMQGYASFLQMTHSARNEIVISSIEHLSVHNTAQALKQKGFVVKLAPVDSNGIVTEEALLNTLTDKTALVCIISVNNEIGTIQPINELARQVKEKDTGIIFITDSAQALGKAVRSYDLKVVDAFFGSGHKIGAPKGCGFFYLNPAVRILPITFGGGQESGYRPGTVDPVLSTLLAKALKESVDNLDANYAYVAQLNTALCDHLSRLGVSFKRVVDQQLASPYICSLIFPDIKGNRLIAELSKRDYYISGGSACSSSCGTKSRIIEAIGRSDVDAMGVVRISFSIHNKLDDVVQLSAAIGDCITEQKLKKV